jgi:hypothetical protein
MNEKQRSANFALKRSQAQRNCESRIQKILFSAAKQIVSASKKYRAAGSLARESSLLVEARNITSALNEQVSSVINAYAEASCKILGISKTSVVTDYLASDIFGKTTSVRNGDYLRFFAEDIVRMVKAGTLMSYTDSQLLSAVRTGYKDPYSASVITKAKRKDISIDTPSYGKGFYRNAYSNIIRNASSVIALAWAKAEQEFGEENDAIGFRVYRGSSFPCAVCDDEVAKGLQSFNTGTFPPFHVHCVCSVRFEFDDTAAANQAAE